MSSKRSNIVKIITIIIICVVVLVLTGVYTYGQTPSREQLNSQLKENLQRIEYLNEAKAKVHQLANVLREDTDGEHEGLIAELGEKWNELHSEVQKLTEENTELQQKIDKKNKKASKHQQQNNNKTQEVQNEVKENNVNKNNVNESNSQNNNTIVNDSNVMLLARLLNAEGASGNLEDYQLVGTVVMNRIAASTFPNTLQGVIYQSGQYTCVGNRKFNSTPPQMCIDVAIQLLSGERYAPANVVFQAQFKQGSGVYKQVGVHYYCYGNI